MRLLIFLTTLACTLPSVWSHTYLVSPKPRNAAKYSINNPVAVGDVIKYGYTNNGMFPSFNTIGWCGTSGAPQTAPPSPTVVSNFPAPAVTTRNTFTAGGTIQVYWWHALPHEDDNLGTAALPIFKYGVRVAVNYSSTDMVVLNVHTGGPAQSRNGIVNGHIEQGTGSDPQANAVGFVPSTTYVLPADKTCTNCVLQFWLDSESDGGGYVDCADISIQAATTTAPTNRATSAPTNQPTSAPTNPPTSTPAQTQTTTAPGNMATSAPTSIKSLTTKPPTSPTLPNKSGAASVSSNVALIIASLLITLLWI